MNYKFKFNNTHFVNQLLIKLGNWGPFNLKGNLTIEGISFIEDKLTEKQPTDFNSYRLIV